MQEAISKKILELSQKEQALMDQYFNLIGRAKEINVQLATVQATLRELEAIINGEANKKQEGQT